MAARQPEWLPALQRLAPQTIAKGSAGYDAAREERIWNKRLAKARAPDAIVPIRASEELQGVVRFASRHGVTLTPRGGGHSYEATALRDGGIMLDLGPLDMVAIDSANRTAKVGPGVKGGALIGQLVEKGLAFPIGHCSDVALSGYLLSGGFGWNSGNWGPACASVLAVEVVLASGEVVTASEREYPDLFWAARGSGSGFFAAVSSYVLQLHELPGTVFAWSGAFAAKDAKQLAPWLDEAARRSHDSAEITCLVGPHMKTGEPAVMVRAEATGASEAEARSRIAAFTSPPQGAQAIGETSESVMGFDELTKLSAMPGGKRVAADHLWSKGSLGEMLLAVHHLAGVPDTSSTVNLFGLGAAGTGTHELDGSEFALSRGGRASVGIYAIWDDPDHDARHREWVRAVDKALSPFRTGRYVGEADLGAGTERLEQCFAPDALARIEALRSQYDPMQLFGGFPV